MTRERERGSNNKHKKKKKKVPVVVVGGVRVFYGCNLRAPGQLRPGHRLFILFFRRLEKRGRLVCVRVLHRSKREKERKEKKRE